MAVRRDNAGNRVFYNAHADESFKKLILSDFLNGLSPKEILAKHPATLTSSTLYRWKREFIDSGDLPKTFGRKSSVSTSSVVTETVDNDEDLDIVKGSVYSSWDAFLKSSEYQDIEEDFIPVPVFFRDGLSSGEITAKEYNFLRRYANSIRKELGYSVTGSFKRALEDYRNNSVDSSVSIPEDAQDSILSIQDTQDVQDDFEDSAQFLLKNRNVSSVYTRNSDAAHASSVITLQQIYSLLKDKISKSLDVDDFSTADALMSCLKILKEVLLKDI